MEKKILVNWVSPDGLSENQKWLLKTYRFKYDDGPFILIKRFGRVFATIKKPNGETVPVLLKLLRPIEHVQKKISRPP